MTHPAADKLTALVVAALEAADAVSPALAEAMPTRLEDRSHDALFERLAKGIELRMPFEDAFRWDLDALLAVVAQAVEEGTTITRWHEWPEGYVGDEPYERSYTQRTARAERLAPDLAALTTLRNAIAAALRLRDAEHAARLMLAEG